MQEYPNIGVGQRFRSFLRDNQDIITFFAFSTNTFSDCLFDGEKLEDIIYKVLRCGLLHEGSIPDEIEFIDQIELGKSGEQWRFPKTYVIGGILAVIGAKSNTNEKVPPQYVVKIMGKSYQVNNLWGQGDDIRQIMASV